MQGDACIIYKIKQRRMNPMIDSFRGKYFFLSNFYEAPVTYNGLPYRNNEAAFQAQKTFHHHDRICFTNVTPNIAKHMGRSLPLRHDWNAVRYQIMKEIVTAKFTQNLDLLMMLSRTQFEKLEEGNDWGDVTWGTVKGYGKNWLGEILMSVRENQCLEWTGHNKQTMCSFLGLNEPTFIGEGICVDGKNQQIHISDIILKHQAGIAIAYRIRPLASSELDDCYCNNNKCQHNTGVGNNRCIKGAEWAMELCSYCPCIHSYKYT